MFGKTPENKTLLCVQHAAQIVNSNSNIVTSFVPSVACYLVTGEILQLPLPIFQFCGEKFRSDIKRCTGQRAS